MNWAVIITIILIGILGLVLEFLVVPGGIVGVISGLIIAGGVGWPTTNTECLRAISP